jgi:hypothetical protein
MEREYKEIDLLLPVGIIFAMITIVLVSGMIIFGLGVDSNAGKIALLLSCGSGVISFATLMQCLPDLMRCIMVRRRLKK